MYIHKEAQSTRFDLLFEGLLNAVGTLREFYVVVVRLFISTMQVFFVHAQAKGSPQPPSNRIRHSDTRL